MAPAPVARRVSYVIPPPSGPRTKLVLPALDAPRRGRTVPLVIPDTPASPDAQSSRHRVSGPRPHSPVKQRSGSGTVVQPTHRLGVSALAVDLSTHIAGKSSPEGILYSAGRDGLVIAWELGAPTKPRRRKRKEPVSMRQRDLKGDWKAMTGWDEDQDLSDEDTDDSDANSALDFDENHVLDQLSGAPPPSATHLSPDVPDKSIPYERRWQVDCDRLDALEPVRTLSTTTSLMLTPSLAFFVPTIRSIS